MKLIKPLNIKGYEFSDLVEKAQEKVINEHIEFWLEMGDSIYNTVGWENFTKAVDKANEMRTPWFTGSYVYDYCKDEILEELNGNGHLYDSEGNQLPLTLVIGDDNKVSQVRYRLSPANEVDIELEDIGANKKNMKTFDGMWAHSSFGVMIRMGGDTENIHEYVNEKLDKLSLEQIESLIEVLEELKEYQEELRDEW